MLQSISCCCITIVHICNVYLQKKLYIRRFVDPMDEASLLEICKKYGEIEKSPLIVKQNKGSLAYAIVAFKSSESAQLAIEGLIGDYGLQVDYAITRKNPVSYSKVSGLSNNNNN